jgi:hypothetical protein
MSMLKSISLMLLALLLLAGTAGAEQKKAKQQIKAQPVAATISPQDVQNFTAQISAQALMFAELKKGIADNHKLLMELKHDVAQVKQQLTVLTAQETAQQQKFADLQTRLQSVQNGVAGLTNVQAQIASDVLHTGQYVIDDWQRGYQNCRHLVGIIIRQELHLDPRLRDPPQPCDNSPYNDAGKQTLVVPFNQQNFMLESIPGPSSIVTSVPSPTAKGAPLPKQ